MRCKVRGNWISGDKRGWYIRHRRGGEHRRDAAEVGRGVRVERMPSSRLRFRSTSAAPLFLWQSSVKAFRISWRCTRICLFGTSSKSVTCGARPFRLPRTRCHQKDSKTQGPARYPDSDRRLAPVSSAGSFPSSLPFVTRHWIYEALRSRVERFSPRCIFSLALPRLC